MHRLLPQLKALPRGLRSLLLTVLVVLAILLGQGAGLVVDGLRDEIGHADLLVVLGNKVERDGTVSPRLLGRLQRAADLYRKGLAPKILVSGGIGIEGFDEAVAMRDWLLKQGVPDNAIVLDQDGYDTFRTARSAKEWLDSNSKESVLIVTQYWHISRTKVAMRRAGIRQVYSAHAKYFGLRDFYSIPRELPALWKYTLLLPKAAGISDRAPYAPN